MKNFVADCIHLVFTPFAQTSKN